MNGLEILIEKLCPNGVEYKKIEEFTSFEQPTKFIVKNTRYNDSYETPVLTAGQTFILGYTDEKDGIYSASKDNPVIIFDDFTGSYKWVDFPFKVKSSAMKIITTNEDKLLIRFLYHIMGYLNFTSDEHKRLWISTYSQMKTAIPPLEVQREIVRILDNFTELTAELTAELTKRQKQYEYYRDFLLDFKSNLKGGSNAFEFISLSSSNKILRGKRLTSRNMSNDGKYNVYHGGIEPLGKYDLYNRKGDTVMIINVGASAGLVGYSNENFWSSDGCFCLEHSKKYLNKFLYYYLLTKQAFLQSKVRRAGIPTLDNNIVKKIQVPVIPLSKQERIVNILDKFDSYCNDISKGLPAEIEARQKQYEFYREKLLTFKRLEG